MYNYPYIDQEFESFDSDFYRQDQFSYVRALHASPDAPAVDVYVNDRLVARNLSYKNFTPYFRLPTGLYNISVFPTGTKANPVIRTQLQLPARTIYTLAARGILKDIAIQPILDPIVPYAPGTSLIRFIHLSPNTPPVDITLPNGQRIFQDVEYTEVTGYIPVRPGTYTIQARPTGTEKVALLVPNIRLLPNRIYSIYAVGLLDGKPPQVGS